MAGQCLRPPRSKYHNINLAVSVGKRQTSLTQDTHYCVAMIVLSLFLFRKEKTYIHTAHGNRLAKRVTEKEQCWSFHHGSAGNHKGGRVLCGESEPTVVFGVSRDSTSALKDTIKHLLCGGKDRNPETTISACRNWYICIHYCRTKFKYIKQYWP